MSTATLFVRHQVADYSAWRAVYDSVEDLRQQYGCLGAEVMTDPGNKNDISDRFSWSGTITPKKASGPESFDLAAFDNQKGLQDCATGTVPWSAQALVPASKSAAPHAAVNVTITKAADGTVHFTVSR